MSKQNGEIIKIRFDENLSCLSYEQITKHFKISYQEYDMAPNGQLIYTEKEPYEIAIQDDILTMKFNSGVLNSFQRAFGEINISYDGGALIIGEDNPLPSFTTKFTPEDLDPKNNPNYEEHLDVDDILVSANLVPVGWIDGFNNEHVEISEIYTDAKLTNIDDI